LAEARRCFDRWARSVRVADPDFEYVVVVERHQSGFLHLHAAVRLSGAVKYNHLRRLWHSALLLEEGVRVTRMLTGAAAPGNIDVSTTRRGGESLGASARRMARYIAKYLAKDCVTEFGRKAYSSSRGINLQTAKVFWLKATTQEGARREALALLGVDPDLPLESVAYWSPGEHLEKLTLFGGLPP
jgi:hypothetical protein